MELYVLAGDDDLAIRDKVTALFGESGSSLGAAERVDVAAEGGAALVEVVSSTSLFGGRRVCLADHLEGIDDTSLEALLRAAPGSDAFVVARAAKSLSPKARENLKKVGKVTVLNLPKGKGVGARIDTMIESSGVQLDGRTRRLLLERASHDLYRLDSVLRQLKVAGMLTPTLPQVELLLGSTSAPGVPWDLTDAVFAGDVAKALRLAEHLEPIPTIGYLVSQVSQAGKLVDNDVQDPQGAQDLLKIAHRFQAEKLLRTAKRLGASGVDAAWDVLLRADHAAKSTSHADTVLDQAIISLARISTSVR